MTDEERAIPKLTRRRLRTLPNWLLWDATCDKQLEAHYTAGAFLDPIPHPEHIPGMCLNILQIHWTFAIKDDGTRKARATMDGSKQAAPWLRIAVKTYASCIGQSLMKLFFTIAATNNKIVIIADTTNAYQQAPHQPNHASWKSMKHIACGIKRSSKEISILRHLSFCLAVLYKVIQKPGLSEKMIVEILETVFAFKSTTHERNIYRGEVKGEVVFIC